MPQVASDPKIYSHSQTLPRVARPPQQSDRPPSPFESLLDDSAQGAEQPPPPPPDHKAAPADNSHAPAKTNDSKAPGENDTATTAKHAATGTSDKTDESGKPAGDQKADVKGKAAAATGDSIKTTNDNDKPADGSKTDTPATTPSTGNIQALTTPDAVVISSTSAPAPQQTPATAEQTIQPADAAAILAAGAPNLKGADSAAPKGVTGKLADGAKKVDDYKQAGAAADATIESPPTKAAPHQHTDKSQSSSTENDKDHIAAAPGEIPTNNHRGETDAPAPLPADAGVASKLSTDATQPAIVNTTQTTAPAATNPVFATPAAPLAPSVPLAGLAIDIAGKALEGKNRFEIRLDPPELGRIEVRLDVDRDGNVTSRLTVDRADTLDLLRRDASGLERALQDAGLKTADNGLQFSLRDQSMSQQQTNTGADTAQIVVKDETLPTIDVIPQNYGRLAGQGNGLDIRV